MSCNLSTIFSKKRNIRFYVYSSFFIKLNVISSELSFSYFSVTYTGDMEAMTNYIMDRTGVTSRSQVFAMSIRQYYLALKEDERIKATRTV